MSTDQAIEQEIQDKGKTAARVTPADIEASIASEHYFTAADGMRFGWLTDDHSDPAQRDAVARIAERIRTSSHASISQDIDANCNGVVSPSLCLLTFCVLVLRNGFTVTGESSCASPENFDAEIGRKVARQNAMQKIWPLLGYQLRDRLANAPAMAPAVAALAVARDVCENNAPIHASEGNAAQAELSSKNAASYRAAIDRLSA